MGFWGVLRVKMWKYCVLTHKRHYPALNTRLLVYRMSKSVQRRKLSRSVERFCVGKNKKKLSGNFGYMGRSNPWGDLDQMWRVGRYGGHNYVCNISWLSVKGCGCGERGNFAFSHWLEASPLQNWSQYRVMTGNIIYVCIKKNWVPSDKKITWERPYQRSKKNIHRAFGRLGPLMLP